MDDLRTTQFSFLTSGPTFSFEMVSDFASTPDLSSPLLNGRGGRSFDYTPSERDPGQPEGTVQVGTLQDRYAHDVELYWRLESPPLWWLRWQLDGGFLYSHLREEDGEAMALITVRSLDIIQTGSGPPFLLVDEPLQFAASSRPGYQERAIFLSNMRGPQWSVIFQRPGFTPQGSVLFAPEEYMGDRVLLRAGLGNDMDVWVWGEHDREAVAAIADDIRDSFAIA